MTADQIAELRGRLSALTHAVVALTTATGNEAAVRRILAAGERDAEKQVAIVPSLQAFLDGYRETTGLIERRINGSATHT